MDYDPRELKNASLNIELYGEHLPPELLESISQFGIREPLLVCRSDNPDINMVVVSGRRRRMAAIRCGLKTVPCREIKLQTTDELNMELILHNVRTDLTTEQKTRMYTALKGIQERLAEARMRAGKAVEKTATSREAAAKAVGMSATTAERAKKVIEVVDEMVSSGDVKGAEKVVAALNTSVSKAEQMVEKKAGKSQKSPSSPAIPKWKRDVSAAVLKIESAVLDLLAGVKEVVRGLDAMQRESPNNLLFKDMERLVTELGDKMPSPQSLAKMLAIRWSQEK